MEIHYIENLGSVWVIFWLFKPNFEVFRPYNPYISLYIYIPKPVSHAIPDCMFVGVKSRILNIYINSVKSIEKLIISSFMIN